MELRTALILDGPLLLLVILPLSIAAGVDLYLTLMFLSAAPRLGWTTPPPGELADLAVPLVLGAALALYVAERWVERSTLGAVFWDVAHTVIRPMAGGLLAWLALANLPLATRVGGALGAGALALAAHVTRSGWGLLLALMPAPMRVRVLVSLAEDVGTIALLSLLLDAPAASAGLSVFVVVAGLRWGASASSAFIFALRMLRDAARAVLRHRRWRGPERFPDWVRGIVEDPVTAAAGGLRGSPAGALRVPGLGLFRRGWVVVRANSSVFLYRWRKRPYSVGLVAARAVEVHSTALLTRVVLEDPQGRRFVLYFSPDGPSAEELRSQFSGTGSTALV